MNQIDFEWVKHRKEICDHCQFSFSYPEAMHFAFVKGWKSAGGHVKEPVPVDPFEQWWRHQGQFAGEIVYEAAAAAWEASRKAERQEREA